MGKDQNIPTFNDKTTAVLNTVENETHKKQLISLFQKSPKLIEMFNDAAQKDFLTNITIKDDGSNLAGGLYNDSEKTINLHPALLEKSEANPHRLLYLLGHEVSHATRGGQASKQASSSLVEHTFQLDNFGRMIKNPETGTPLLKPSIDSSDIQDALNILRKEEGKADIDAWDVLQDYRTHTKTSVTPKDILAALTNETNHVNEGKADKDKSFNPAKYYENIQFDQQGKIPKNQYEQVINNHGTKTDFGRPTEDANYTAKILATFSDMAGSTLNISDKNKLFGSQLPSISEIQTAFDQNKALHRQKNEASILIGDQEKLTIPKETSPTSSNQKDGNLNQHLNNIIPASTSHATNMKGHTIDQHTPMHGSDLLNKIISEVHEVSQNNTAKTPSLER